MSFNIDQFTLGQKLFRSLCNNSPSYTACIFRLRENFSGGIFEAVIGSYGKENYFFTICRYFYKRVFGNVSDENNFVDRFHKKKLIF